MKTNPLLLLFAWIPVVMAQPVLEVRVHNRAGVPETALARTAQVVADILGKAGIGLRWKVAPPNSPEASRMVLGNGRGAIQLPERRCAARRDIALLISTDSPALATLRLGQAEPLSPSGINATVYYSRVISAANRYGVTVEAVLGHAITHEIGHVMLRTWDHRKGFLMSGAWEGPHFRAIRSSGMSFEAQDAQSIRETLEGKDCPGTDMEGPETVAALRAGKEFEAKPGVERMAGPENVPVQPRLRQDGMDALLSGVRPCRVPAPEAVTAGYVESCRPSAIDEKERAAVRRSLPREGEITNLTQEQRRKLALLKQIFRAHKT